MGEVVSPQPVKLICGILASDLRCLQAAQEALQRQYGRADCISEVWPFTQTDYYREQTGPSILRNFLAFEQLIEPGRLAEIKHQTNELEKKLAEELKTPWPRPVNLDPGYLEPAKLVLASTKNFSHRIYIGQNMYAEVTLMFHKGAWRSFEFTFPDFRGPQYHGFLSEVRERLIRQRRELHEGKQ
ncbi:MAG TPA: DUF4416 family protein [Anaerohalosphaeraceae bacterium]|nr:DUF4416 family protein [Anaerohalosphaeraceae bacterium]HOL88372.1 DUF4416 family protein [Anaerohalosphaeraceae bacterium]HPP55024.1 DUF4416 family protein [Anaerohalosphaeraceae bacterium]